jgi:hypothetical protein
VNHYLTHLHNGELWALKSEYLKTIIYVLWTKRITNMSDFQNYLNEFS